jgi:hypothetical protein
VRKTTSRPPSSAPLPSTRRPGPRCTSNGGSRNSTTANPSARAASSSALSVRTAPPPPPLLPRFDGADSLRRRSFRPAASAGFASDYTAGRLVQAGRSGPTCSSASSTIRSPTSGRRCAGRCASRPSGTTPPAPSRVQPTTSTSPATVSDAASGRDLRIPSAGQTGQSRFMAEQRCRRDALGCPEGALVRAAELPRTGARARHRTRQPLQGALRTRTYSADRAQTPRGHEGQAVIRADPQARLLRVPDRRPNLQPLDRLPRRLWQLTIKDRTGNEPGRAYTLRQLKPDDAIEAFPGLWGRDNRLKLLSLRAVTGDGPCSPPDQSAWVGPGRNMLCSAWWPSRDQEMGAKSSWPPVREQ